MFMNSVGRLGQISFLSWLAACTGMLHIPAGKDLDVATSATFSLLTMSDYDTPYAEWSELSTDENFMSYECLVERTSQVTSEVTETGIWETCTSPYDLREAPGIEVAEGFNGQFTVRAVSMSGNAGESVTKKFRRALWSGGVDGTVNSLAVMSNSVLFGGSFTGIYNSLGQTVGRVVRLDSDGSVDLSMRGFVEGFDDVVNAVAVQSDGKILLGGGFASYNGEVSAPDFLIRVNADGVRDTSFNGTGSGFNDWIWEITLQEDGKILVGGNFSVYNGESAAPDSLIRIHPDGTRDTSFNGTNSGLNGTVYSIALQADGKILVGGNFTSYNGTATAPDRLIRLNADGTRDASFNGTNAGFDGLVRSVKIQDDGKILVGGEFTSYNGEGAAPNYLVRLNADGTRDTSFNGTNSGFNGRVFAISLQADGKILAGGDFSSYNGEAAAPDKLIRINSDGSRDTSFNGTNAGFDNNPVLSVVVQDDGKVLVGGEFTSYNGEGGSSFLVRLNTNGARDTEFKGTGFTSFVQSISLQSDGKFLVGGDFTRYMGGEGSGRAGLDRVNSDATSATDFNGNDSGFNGFIMVSAVQADGKILAGGSFTSYNGASAAPDNFIRLQSDGTVDLSFSGISSGFNNFVESIAVQGDGKILVGGQFTSYNGNASAPDRLIRLSADGSVDGSFSGVTTGFDGPVRAIVVQADGKILVGGNFTSYNGNGSAPDGLIRLNVDGSVDASFSGITTGLLNVESIVVQNDGKILVGGGFTSYNGIGSAPDHLIRLNVDGSVDASFSGVTIGFDANVEAVSIQVDGKVLVGGQFTSYNGNGAARLIRLNADGSVDSSFSGITTGFVGGVYSISMQPDGKILVGGDFTSYNGNAAAPDRIIRLNADGTIDQSFMGQQH